MITGNVNVEDDLYKAMEYVITHMLETETKQPELKNRTIWQTVKKTEFLNRLKNTLSEQPSANCRLWNEFYLLLNCKEIINEMEYPVILVCDHIAYSLLPYEKLCKYAESGKVNFMKYKNGLFTMIFHE